MSERYLSRAKFWKPAPEPYPNVCACIGTEIGVFHDRYWWHAAGPARQQFSLVEPEIVEQLNSVFTERYSSILLFHLYMIGRSRELAIPTIMFFCEEKEPRKMAKKTVDEGGLLAKLPAFRTGHLAKRPEVGNLIQPAGEGEEVERSNGPESASEVYFDPSHHVTAIGMPIFVKQANNVLRRATANAIFDGERFVYLSVAHVFPGDTSSPPATSIANDNSFDFGSGTEDEVENECLAATSRASMSSLEETSDDNPESPPSDSTSSSPQLMGFYEVHSVPSDQDLPDVANLEHLGNMVRYSPDLDWAVIHILHSTVASAVHELKSKMPSKNQKGKSAAESEVTKVVAHTSRGLITGRLFHDATYTRLPGSTTFQKVYQAILDSHLEWGDCGVAILDAVTGQPHGHVVMSSATKEVVYIVLATQVFEESETQWTKIDPDIEETRTQAESSHYGAPASGLLKASKTNSTVQYREEMDSNPSRTDRLAGRSPYRDVTPLATPLYAPSSNGRDPSLKLRTVCDSCAASRVKCSKEKPACERCSRTNLTCIYGVSRRHGRQHGRQHGKLPSSPRSLDKPPMNNPGLQWITATNPDDFRSRSMMQVVRQTAMGSYLGTQTKSNSSSSRSKTLDSAYESKEKSTNPEEEQGSGKRRKL